MLNFDFAFARKKSGACERDYAQTLEHSRPPTSNTGRQERSAESALLSETYSKFVTVDGKLKEVLLRRGVDTSAFIDTLTFTLKESAFLRKDQLGTEDEIISSISSECYDIFGFGLTEIKNGRHGYKKSAIFGFDKVVYGWAMFGGVNQNETVCIYLTGHGLTSANDGWEQRLYEFFKTRAQDAKITRCDLAHDFFNEEYSPDIALSDWESGGYTIRHTKPKAQCVGSDWLSDDNSGKTFAIGSRKCSRYVRVYDKAKEQGDINMNWCRVEVELKSKDIIIPHDILINAGKYITCYPSLELLFAKYKEDNTKCERVQKSKDIGFEHVVKYAKIQCSPAIKMLLNLGFSQDELLDLIFDKNADFPRRLNPACFDASQLNVVYAHQLDSNYISEDSILNKLSASLTKRKHQIKHRNQKEYNELLDKIRADEFFQELKSGFYGSSNYQGV